MILNTVPRVREKGELVRPEARTLEGLRATLFEHLPAPPDPDTAPPQGPLALG